MGGNDTDETREDAHDTGLLMKNMPGYWNVVRVNNWRYGCGGTREKSLRVNASASLIQM
jgi:hypothetical protein